MQDRAILHSDANAFYASVECALDPELKGKAVAVCGSAENRHGIVLAKSEKAKRAGVKTAMTNWEAKRLCPELIMVPPHHEIYAEFSARLHEIYGRYTDFVEPFGLDECWLDVTGNLKAPKAIAEEIRVTVKAELGITVSVGVSFNKVFAKLGSDLKKPDAVTEITKENFRQTVWDLPCSDLLYCGKATTEKLRRFGIHNIGEMAKYPREFFAKHFGKNGEQLWKYACGLDDAPVARFGEREQAKSVGHGITCVTDLENAEEVNAVIAALSQDVGRRLRRLGLQARGISLTVRDSGLAFVSWQQMLEGATQSSVEIAAACTALLKARYRWERKIRAVTVSAIHLESVRMPCQLSLFSAGENGEKRRKIEEAIDKLDGKFGKGTVKPAVLLGENKLPESAGSQAHLPKPFRR